MINRVKTKISVLHLCTLDRLMLRSKRRKRSSYFCLSCRVQIQGHMPGPTISEMLVYHTSRQTGVSACSYDNGGCQHICLTAPGGQSRCACPAQYKLKRDNVTCSGMCAKPVFSVIVCCCCLAGKIVVHKQLVTGRDDSSYDAQL